MTILGTKISSAQLGRLHIFYVGQAGFIFKSPQGYLSAVDLYLSDCVERFENTLKFKRLIPNILNPFECSFDAVIATHPHLDHLDIDSVPILMSSRRTRLFASLNCESELRKRHINLDNTNFVKPGDSFVNGDVQFKFVDCDHGIETPDAVGVLIEIANKRIYLTGDTCLRMDRVPMILNEGAVDILIAPINGAYGNMNEEECAAFAAALKVKLVIPFHYGMFAAHGGDVGKFMDIMNLKYPELKYYIMTPGEQLTL